MIITISGKAGSGKSSVAKAISQRLNLKHYSVGDVMREMAKERGITLLKLNNLAEKDSSIDKELDDRLVKLSKTQKNFVIDGRLTAFFIPHADFRIFLDAPVKTRAERILLAQRKDEKHATLNETISNIKKREESEKKRYKQYYNVDYTDKKLYTHIINTAPLELKEVVDKIVGITGKNPFSELVCPKCQSTDWKFPNPIAPSTSMINMPGMVNNLYECSDCGYVGVFFKIETTDLKKPNKNKKS